MNTGCSRKIVLVISTLLIPADCGEMYFPVKSSTAPGPSRRTCSSGIRTHHPSAGRPHWPAAKGELVSSDTGHRPPSKETEETIRNSDHSPEHHLQRHPFQIRNGQGNYSASEWKKNLRIKLA